MITPDLSVLMNWFLAASAAVVVWAIIGLIAVKCEIKWGFPFDFKGYYNGLKNRSDFAEKCLNEEPVKNIFKGPLMFVSMALSGLASISIRNICCILESIEVLFFKGLRFK